MALRDEDGLAAATKGDARALALCLKLGSSPDLSDAFGNTLLMLASAGGHRECVRLLLDHGARCEVTNREGENALHVAVENPRNGHVPRALLDYGALPDARDSLGRTPLMIAATSGNLAAVDALLARGADTNLATAEQETALTFAVTWHHAEIVERLVTAGAEVDATDAGGWTALTYAAFEGQDTIAALLLQHSADPDRIDIHGQSILMHAVRGKHEPTVAAIAAAARTPEYRDPSGTTAADQARAQHTDSLAEIIERHF